MRLAVGVAMATALLVLLAVANLHAPPPKPPRAYRAAPRAATSSRTHHKTTLATALAAAATATAAAAATTAPAAPDDAASSASLPERSGYTFWSTDYHIAPIADIADIFRSICERKGPCMSVEENSFSGACGKTFGGRKPTCARNLRVINKDNAFDLCPRPHALRRRFFHAYSGPSSALQHVDAFVCNHPPALCELYMPFNKSIIVFASVNLEFSRENPTRWFAWLASLRAIAADPRNVVAANNPYDAEYIRYFTGIQAEYIPSYCGYAARAQYDPEFTRPVLIARNHNNPSAIIRQMHDVAARAAPPPRSFADVGGNPPPLAAAQRLRFVRTEDAYPRGFEYADLARHPAVVLLPYTKSVMSFFELYRMNVPLFAPSLQLLVEWERDYSLLTERIYWTKAPRPESFPNVTTFSPNTRRKKAALRHWLALCDFYHFPNITYFDSMGDLLAKLQAAPLREISASMANANENMLSGLRSKWRALFVRMFGGRPPGFRSVPTDYEGAMMALYGFVPGREPPCKRESRPEYGEWA